MPKELMIIIVKKKLKYNDKQKLIKHYYTIINIIKKKNRLVTLLRINIY